MTADRSFRAFPSDLEIRGGGDGRTLVGISAPFDSPAEIADWAGTYTERIKRGAFARTIRERGPHLVKLMSQHNMTELPIGRATVLREDPAGLYSEFRVSRTPRGDEALELVKDGTLDGLSIGFRVMRDDWSTDHRERTVLEARLFEVSVVSHPAYQDALILGSRSNQSPHPRLEIARMRLDLLSKVTPHV